MHGVKPIPDLDPETTERMLAGALEPDDAPPGYSDVVRVLRAATAPPERTSPAREAWAVAAGQQILGEDCMDLLADIKRGSGSKYLRAKVIGVVTVGTMLGTSGMAMAGALPASLQDAASKVFDTVGITVPVGHPASTGSEISGIATTTPSVGVAKGQQISTIASGGKSQAGQHGSPSAASSHANAHATTHGGNGTGHGESHGASDHGSSTASSHSQGHSGTGSGHASSHSPAH
jgi:hypothetical protein